MMEIETKRTELKARQKIEIKEPNIDVGDYNETSKHWNLVQKSIDENKGNRLDWKEILKCSLTEYVARLRNEGLNQDEIIKLTCMEHPFLRREDYFNKLNIGVNARFGEMKTAEGVKDV